MSGLEEHAKLPAPGRPLRDVTGPGLRLPRAVQQLTCSEYLHLDSGVTRKIWGAGQVSQVTALLPRTEHWGGKVGTSAAHGSKEPPRGCGEQVKLAGPSRACPTSQLCKDPCGSTKPLVSGSWEPPLSHGREGRHSAVGEGTRLLAAPPPQLSSQDRPPPPLPPRCSSST